MRGQAYFNLIAEAATKQGIDPTYLAALIEQESGFNPNARSPVGALGIAQFMPGTAKEYGIDPLDPKQAISAAAKYLKRSLNMFGGDYGKALASYNAGPGAVQKYKGIPPYKETQNYVRRITANRGGYRDFFGQPVAAGNAPLPKTAPPQNQGLGALLPPAPMKLNVPAKEQQKWFSLIDNTWQPPVM